MKASKRIFSMLLALIMVLALCPVITLSAVEPEIEVWDGKVPGTDKTLKEIIASGESVNLDEIPNLSDHIVFTGEKSSGTIEIKTGGGLALYSVISNNPFTLNEKTSTADHFINRTWGTRVFLSKDIYLNDPTVDRDEWTNEFEPILKDGLPDGADQSNWFYLNFDGNGHFIYGLHIDETVTEANNVVCYGGLFGVIPCQWNGSCPSKIQNLALLGLYMDIEALPEGDSMQTVYVGGLYAKTRGTSDQMIVNNCVIDADLKLTYRAPGTASFGQALRPFISGGITADPETLNGNCTHQFNNCLVQIKAEGVKHATVLEGAPAPTVGGVIAGGWNKTNVPMENIIVSKASFTSCHAAANGVMQGHNAIKDALKNIVSAAGGLASPYNAGKYASTNKQVSIDNLRKASYFTNTLKAAIIVGEETVNPFSTWTTQAKDGYLPTPVAFAGNAFLQDQMGYVDPDTVEVIEIGTAAELEAWTLNPGTEDRVVLTANIDMKNNTWHEISNFNGSFDGQGYAISNLSVTRDTHNGSTVKGRVGGLFNHTTAGMTFKNVALLNFKVTFTTAGENSVGDNSMMGGMILGGTDNASNVPAYFSNVYIAGDLDATATKGLPRFGLYAGYTGHTPLLIENCAFIGSASHLTYLWGTAGTVTVSSSYIAFTKNVANMWWNWQGSHSYTKVYTAGGGFKTTSNTNDANHPASKPAAGFTVEDINGKIFFNDIIGDKMQLGGEWYTYADGTPVQKVFGATAEAAKALSAAKDLDLDYSKADDFIRIMGASVRTAAGSTGIRFSVEVNSSAENAVYGMLIIPSELLDEGGETIANSAQTLNVLVGGLDADGIVNATKHTDKWGTRFADHAQYNVALVNLPADAREMEFTVCAYVDTNGDGEADYYSDVKTYTPVDIAIAAYNANDNAAAIASIYGDLASFQTATGYVPVA